MLATVTLNPSHDEEIVVDGLVLRLERDGGLSTGTDGPQGQNRGRSWPSRCGKLAPIS